MPAYDVTKAFCTEQDVFDFGGYTWTDGPPATTPSATAVQGFAYAKASEIVLVTQRAGMRTVPPTSAIGDVHLGRTLQEANAKGAAYEAWRVMAAKNPDDWAIEQMERLRRDWESFVGYTDDSGDYHRGVIEQAIESAIHARTIDNDATGGETTLTTHDAEERPAPFTMTDRL